MKIILYALVAQLAVLQYVFAEHAPIGEHPVTGAASSESDDVLAYLWLQVPKLQKQLGELQGRAGTTPDKAAFDSIKAEFDAGALETKVILRALNRRLASSGSLAIADDVKITKADIAAASDKLQADLANMKTAEAGFSPDSNRRVLTEEIQEMGRRAAGALFTVAARNRNKLEAADGEALREFFKKVQLGEPEPGKNTIGGKRISMSTLTEGNQLMVKVLAEKYGLADKTSDYFADSLKRLQGEVGAMVGTRR